MLSRMRTANMVFRLRRSIAERGLRGTTLRVVKKIYRRVFPVRIPTHPFDLRYGVDTSGLLGKALLDSGHANDRFVTAYWGTAPSLFDGAFGRWGELLSGTHDTPCDFALLDVGCGKGRVLMQASEMPFWQIIGVELNPALVAIAQKNLEVWKRSDHACNDLVVVNADVLAVALPDSPVLIYLFNPFDAPVVQLFLDRLSSLVLTRSDPIDLIYARPEHAHLFDSVPNMRLLGEGEVSLTPEETAADAFETRTLDYRIYRLTSPAQAIR